MLFMSKALLTFYSLICKAFVAICQIDDATVAKACLGENVLHNFVVSVSVGS